MKIILGAFAAAISAAALAQSAASPPAQGAATQGAAAAQAPAPSAPFDPAVAKKVIATLADTLEENFLSPETGAAYATMLRGKLASGAYDSFPDARAFSDTVTADIHAIQPDGHLRLQPPLVGAAPGAPPAPRPASDNGVQKGGWIAPGIAYISFGSFDGAPETLAKVERFLADHASAKTLIIDARVHRGGGLAEMDLIFPAIYAEPAVLLQMDTRAAVDAAGRGAIGDGPTVRRLDGPAGVVRREHFVTPSATPTALRTATVYLLTSGRTASAAEHLAMSLKRTGRATLIGETTAGAGNFGGGANFEGGYRAFIPVGRTFDPVTGKGWEGTGVDPDVAVPAEAALAEALRRAGLAPDEAERLSAEWKPEGSMARRMPLRH